MSTQIAGAARRVRLVLGLVLAAMLPQVTTAQALRLEQPEVLVAPRTVDSVRTEREHYARLRGEAQDQSSTARARMEEAKTQIEVLELEIDQLKRRIDTADQLDRETEKTRLEAEKERLERRRQWHERRRDLRAAEMELARAEVEYANAAVQALDLEEQLQRNRGESADSSVLASLEQKTLEARVQEEYRRRTMSERRVTAAERALALIKTQRELRQRTT